MMGVEWIKNNFFLGLMGISFLFLLFLALWFNQLTFLGFPFAVLAVVVFCLKPQWAYYLLIATLPLTDEFHLGGFAIYLPAEPLLIFLMLYLLVEKIQLSSSIWSVWKSPIFLLLMLHLAWIGIGILYSVDILRTLKYFLAKCWFIFGFYLATVRFISDFSVFKRVFKWLYLFTLTTILIILIKHGIDGFGYKEAYKVIRPFYRNHVDYAAFVCLFIPFLWFGRHWYSKFSFMYYALRVGWLLFPIAVIASYTRAAMGLMLLYPLIYAVIYFKKLYTSIVFGVIAVLLGVSWLLSDYNYMNYKPNYDTTIMYSDFGRQVSATVNFEDLSSMERIYRWVAGGHMIADKPLVGYGGNTFYPTYKDYVVSAFRTYASDNKEKSGVHNFLLMITIEQGVIGLILWVVFSLVVLILLYKVFLIVSDEQRQIAASLLLFFIGVHIINSINDMIANVKIGGLFFIFLGLSHLLVQGKLKSNPKVG